MIVSFYDRSFKGLQNNASLVVDRDSLSIVKRPAESNSMTCKCEAFTEDIQPAFVVVKDDHGRYVYGSLAGIPTINGDNVTEITGTDLKMMLSSDVILNPGTYGYVTGSGGYIDYVFGEWKSQVNRNYISCELQFRDYLDDDPVQMDNINGYFPATGKAVYNAWEEIQSYLRYYNLYMETEIDLKNKKVLFIVGKTMLRERNIKLWEYGIRDYGKWVASVNETQGYYVNESTGAWSAGTPWILTSKNEITQNEEKRDIFPVRKKIVTSTESAKEANAQAIETLLENMYNENIEITESDLVPEFETKFRVYLKRGDKTPYKELPCGELRYNASGLSGFQIGCRYTGAEFI